MGRKSTLSSAKSFPLEDMLEERSLMDNRKRIGPSTVPWGTLDRTGDHLDEDPFTTTRCLLPERKSRS